MPYKAFLLGRNTGSLRHCLDDVVHMQRALAELDYDEVVTAPTTASANEVAATLDALLENNTAQKDTLVVYFSGHSLIRRGKLYLVLGDNKRRRSNLYSFDTLFEQIYECPASSKLIILDCCDAGQAVRGWAPPTHDNIRVFTATDQNSKAKEIEELQAGVFTHFLCQALTDPALRVADSNGVVDADGNIGVNETAQWLRRTIEDYGRRIKRSLPMPELYGPAVRQNIFLAKGLALSSPSAASQSINANASGSADTRDASEVRLRLFSSLRFILDRTKQWRQLTSDCTDARWRKNHLAFLVHGDPGQDVHLFVERIERFWQDECATFVHRAARVLLRFDGTRPCTVNDWHLRLRRAAGYNTPNTCRALERSAVGDPMLFLFCDQPLSAKSLGDDGLKALETFLAKDIPNCLRAGKFTNPIRLLLAVEHAERTPPGESINDPLVQRLEKALWKMKGVKFQQMEALHFPTWDEIKIDFRDHLGYEGFEAIESACEKAYKRVANDPARCSFSNLVKTLDKQIRSLPSLSPGH